MRIVTVTGQFNEIDETITLQVLDHAEEVAFRLTREPPAVRLVFLANEDSSFPPTHNRAFRLIEETAPVPADFVKYIGTFPFGPDKTICHVIEVQP